jgi:alpha-galactosidase
MSYFDVSEDIILNLIDSAKELGFEAVVLDDGWYGKRNDSKSSLGDWSVDKAKFPNGIKSLVEYTKKNNMKFGIWFEPEMISPNTELIKKHPEWTMRSKNYEPILGRSQYFLDLTNNNVQKFIIDTISNAIENYGVEYIKWDMNRHMTDPFSVTNQLQHTNYNHNYILSLYSILDTLTKKYPHVLFENCSSGGGRLDLGMLYYFPQTWISDNTDGLDRQQIQYGVSYIFPISSITGHVSNVPNHQTGRIIPFETRTALASSTNMGYEMNIIDITTKEKESIMNHLYEYKKERELILNGIFYRLSSPFNTNISALMFVNENKTQSIVHIFRNIYNVFELSFIIRIPYLDLSAMYIVEHTNQIFSGAELANCGLTIENKLGDFKNYKVTLRKITG